MNGRGEVDQRRELVWDFSLFVGLGLLVFFGPMGSGTPALAILLPFALGFMVLKWSRFRQAISSPPRLFNLSVAAFVVIMATTSLFGKNLMVSLAATVGYVTLIGVSLLAADQSWNLSATRKSQLMLLGLSGMLLAGLYPIAKFLIDPDVNPGSFLAGHNGYSATALMFLGPTLGYVMNRFGKTWGLVYVGFAGIVLVVNMSRAGWVGYLVLVLLFFADNRKLLKALLVMLLIIVVLVSLVPSLNNLLMARISNLDSGRFLIWSSTLEMVKDKWLTGVGIAGFPFAYKQYRVPGATYEPANAHNILLNMLAETGIFGFVAYSTILLLTMRMGWILYQKGTLVQKGFFVSFMGVLAHEMFDCVIMSVHIGFIFWVLVAAIVVGYQNINQ